MRRLFPLFLLQTAVATLLLTATYAQGGEVQRGCVTTPMDFDGLHSRISVGQYTIFLANRDDDPSDPTWEGPITITEPIGRRTCEVVFDEIGLIKQPLFAFNDASLALVTSSGSNFRVAVVDLAHCNIIGVTENLAGPVVYREGRILSNGRSVENLWCIRP